jgi:hypothetical protein
MKTDRTATQRSRRRSPTRGSQQRPRDTRPAAGGTDDIVRDFVTRTTANSKVPVHVEDASVLEQIARVLS